MSDFLDELSGTTIGGIQTDHGGITIGDVLVLILDFVLLIYTGWRSYDFLSTTVPSGWEMLALVGLWGLDIGAVFWSLTWIFGSTGKFQNWVSISLFLIDLAGVGLTGLTDSLMYGNTDMMAETLGSVTRVAVPIVMFINVVAGFIFHMTSPATRDRRKKRELEAEHADRMREVRETQMKLAFTQAQLLARQETVELAQVMAQIKVLQDRIEQNARKQLRDNRMASVRGQLNMMTGSSDLPAPLLGFSNNNAASSEMETLQEQLGLLDQWLDTHEQKRTDQKPARQRLNILAGINSLKDKFTGASKTDDATADPRHHLVDQLLQDAQNGLTSWGEVARALKKLSSGGEVGSDKQEPLDEKMDENNQSLAIPSIIDGDHPKAGSNGGHNANPTIAS